MQPRIAPVPQSRIIRDVQDGTRDYFIPTARAKELFEQGKLGKVEAYSNGASYCTQSVYDGKVLKV